MAVSFINNKLKYFPRPMVKPVAVKAVTINKPMKKKKTAKMMKGIL